jgi:hypothetical protein
MNHTDNLLQWTFSFCVKARNPREALILPTLWFWNYSSRHETKLKNQRDLVWKKKNGWWPENQVNTHSAFVMLDEDAWTKKRLGTSRNWQAGLKDSDKVFIILKKKKKEKEKRKGTYPDCLMRVSASPLLPQQTRWQELSLTVLYLVHATRRAHSKCILRKWRFASWPGRSILCERELADGSPVAVTALKITSNAFSNILWIACWNL